MSTTLSAAVVYLSSNKLLHPPSSIFLHDTTYRKGRCHATFGLWPEFYCGSCAGPLACEPNDFYSVLGQPLAAPCLPMHSRKDDVPLGAFLLGLDDDGYQSGGSGCAGWRRPVVLSNTTAVVWTTGPSG